jgi:enterochelin esterase family protein
VVTGDASLAELPSAPPEPWLQRVPGASSLISGLFEKALPRREIRESKLHSEILKQERTFAVYTPPQYDANGEPCGLLVMFDGNGCNQTRNNSFPVTVILDNLIAEKRIPPLVAVFVFQTADRNKELACSESFADFVAKELIPQVRRDYRVSSEPARTVVSGLSLGGLMSGYCGFRHPDVFGNVLSLSGSYQWCPGMFEGPMGRDSEPGWLTRQLAKSPTTPVRFYLAAGRFENFFPFSLLGENRRLRDVLQAKDYAVKYLEFSGGHDPVCWRGPFVEGLVWLTDSQSH